MNANRTQPVVHDVIAERGVCATCGETADWIKEMGLRRVEHEHTFALRTGLCRCGAVDPELGTR